MTYKKISSLPLQIIPSFFLSCFSEFDFVEVTNHSYNVILSYVSKQVNLSVKPVGFF